MKNTITLEQAIEMTSRYRSEQAHILNGHFAGQPILSHAETFNREAIDHVLAQAECVGIRVYWGMDAEKRVRAILVGVNECNVDLLPDGSNAHVIVEDGSLCPPVCAADSPLNG